MAPIPSTDPVAFACAVKRAFPAIPSREALAIAVHVCRRGRGRTSRTARGQTLALAAIMRAVENHVRHGHTPYDSRLRTHGDRARARAEIRDDLHAVLHAWRDPRPDATPVACRPCWQTRPRHLRTLEVEAELQSRKVNTVHATDAASPRAADASHAA
jgi:hypothetical protein